MSTTPGFDRLAATLAEIDRMRAASAARDAKLHAELTETAAAMGAHVETPCACGYAEMSRYERNTHECACEPTIEELIEAITNEVVAQHDLRVKLLAAEAQLDTLGMALAEQMDAAHAKNALAAELRAELLDVRAQLMDSIASEARGADQRQLIPVVKGAA